MRKHNEIIKAWADNVDLVVFVRTCTEGAWTLVKDPVQWWDDNEYFASLPEHKNTCLHWLNGGKIQDYHLGAWTNIAPHNGDIDWNDPDNIFMNEEYILRAIKVAHTAYNTKTPHVFESGVELEDALNEAGELYDNHPWQFVEIEYEE